MATPWFAQIEGILSRFKNLSIVHLNLDEEIIELAKRGMNLQCNISDSELTLIEKDTSTTITQRVCK